MKYTYGKTTQLFVTQNTQVIHKGGKISLCGAKGHNDSVNKSLKFPGFEILRLLDLNFSTSQFLTSKASNFNGFKA